MAILFVLCSQLIGLELTKLAITFDLMELGLMHLLYALAQLCKFWDLNGVLW